MLEAEHVGSKYSLAYSLSFFGASLKVLEGQGSHPLTWTWDLLGFPRHCWDNERLNSEVK